MRAGSRLRVYNPVMTGPISVKFTRKPLLEFAMRGDVTVDAYRAGLEEIARILKAEQEPIVILNDLSEFNPFAINAKMRKDAADVWHENREIYLRLIVAEARVVVSPLARGVVTAFDWLTGRGKWPCRNFATLPEGETWLRTQLAAHSERGPGAKPPRAS